jgi:uncharacterized iron-regulated protein
MKKTLLSILFSSQLLIPSIFANQIILLGESDHRNPIYRKQTKQFISQNLNQYNTLALEAFETDKQYLLDNYSKSQSQKDLVQIQNYLGVRWKRYNPESYTQLIKYAVNTNMHIIGIDEPTKKQAKEIELIPVPPYNSKKRKSRETHMAKILCELPFWQNSVVLIGNIHITPIYLPSNITKTCKIIPKLKTL